LTNEMKTVAAHMATTLRSARTALHLTQADVAERIGRSESFYVRLESGDGIPSLETLCRLVRGLGVGADDLLGLASGQQVVLPQPPPPNDPPEVRRLIRLIRKAPPASLRLVTAVLREVPA
jgi:transcriptional regulator with XRE-family HTH domain